MEGKIQGVRPSRSSVTDGAFFQRKQPCLIVGVNGRLLALGEEASSFTEWVSMIHPCMCCER